MDTKRFATYHGVKVEIVEERRVAGGVAVDVRKPDSAVDWPWTVTTFSTAKCNLVFDSTTPGANQFAVWSSNPNFVDWRTNPWGTDLWRANLQGTDLWRANHPQRRND